MIKSEKNLTDTENFRIIRFYWFSFEFRNFCGSAALRATSRVSEETEKTKVSNKNKSFFSFFFVLLTTRKKTSCFSVSMVTTSKRNLSRHEMHLFSENDDDLTRPLHIDGSKVKRPSNQTMFPESEKKCVRRFREY